MASRIVLVEDSEVVRRFAQQLLTRKGFEVTEFPDGSAALEEILKSPPALVISDIQMPHMDGLELTRRLRERHDKRMLPVILVSVLSEEEDIVAGFEAGANDYLIKPYRTAELMAKVSVLLREGGLLRKPSDPVLPNEGFAPPAGAATGASAGARVGAGAAGAGAGAAGAAIQPLPNGPTGLTPTKATSRPVLLPDDEPIGAPPPASGPPAETRAPASSADADSLGSEDMTTVRGAKAAGQPCYFFDQYIVTGEYGRGGMGTVYRAVRRDDQLPVALKVLAPRLSENRTAIARFLREIRVLSGLQSQHVVQVMDHGYDAGRYFLVMEAVEGDPLDRIVLRDGPLPEVETARIFRQVCQALQDLTDQDLVHRDIKPANIIRRGSDAQVKLVDFGLAKHEHEASTLTETGYALGTSYYVAPEVIEGSKADARSDLFAVGVSMFETLTGRRPFPGVVPYQIFKRIVSGPVPDPTEFRAGLSPGLVAIQARLLARDLQVRYQRGADVVADFDAWLASDEGQAAAAMGSPPPPGAGSFDLGR